MDKPVRSFLILSEALVNSWENYDDDSKGNF